MAVDHSHSGAGEQRNGPTYDYRRHSDHLARYNSGIIYHINIITGPHGLRSTSQLGFGDVHHRDAKKHHRWMRQRLIISVVLCIALLATCIGLAMCEGMRHPAHASPITPPATSSATMNTTTQYQASPASTYETTLATSTSSTKLYIDTTSNNIKSFGLATSLGPRPSHQSQARIASMTVYSRGEKLG